MDKKEELKDSIVQLLDSPYCKKKVTLLVDEVVSKTIKEQDATLVKTIQQSLRSLGLDVEKPLEVQKDFSHLRRSRKGTEEVAIWTKRILLGTAISSAIALIVGGVNLAIQDIIHNIRR